MGFERQSFFFSVRMREGSEGRGEGGGGGGGGGGGVCDFSSSLEISTPSLRQRSLIRDGCVMAFS